MINEKYNNWEFKQALMLCKTNPIEAKIKYEAYISTYPKDYQAYTYYAAILITLGEFEKAQEILDYVADISSEDPKFMANQHKLNILKRNLFSNKIRILSYQDNYEALHLICSLHKADIQKMYLNHIDFYACRKVGKVDLTERERHAYAFRQIIEYREEDFYDFISKHLADNNIDVEDPNPYIFAPGFPLQKVIEEIKKHIPSENKLFTGFYENTYMFKYDNCGKDNNKIADYIKVVCFHNTIDIITMFPTANCPTPNYYDLNYLNQINEHPKVKRKSQIDKFNQKYKR